MPGPARAHGQSDETLTPRALSAATMSMEEASIARVLVTGASGNVGREVARLLQQRGRPFRVAGTCTERLKNLFGPEVEAARLDFQDPGTFSAAARGTGAVFLLRPPPIADVGPTLNRFVDVAREVGVQRVVFVSVAGAERSRIIPHHRVEQHLRARGDGYTLLRPGFFAQNLADAYRRDVLEDGRLFVPAGRGRVAFLDVRDLAEVAVRVLEDPAAHERRAYCLTGPEAVTFGDVAAELSRALGYPVRYEPAKVFGYVRHLRRRSLPWSQVAVQSVLHVGLRWGQAEKVDPTLAELLGRPPRTIRDFIADHAGVWRRPPPAPPPGGDEPDGASRAG